MRGLSEVNCGGNKKFCNDSKDDGDLISDLPECVLSRILSFLPTKDAVRTSVLSKVWEYRWTSICNINVDDEVHFSNQRFNDASFMKFMDRILMLSQNIKCFDLCCRRKYHDPSRVGTWISALARYNVENVSLYVTQLVRGFVLSHSLFYCTSLRELVISMMFCTLKFPAKICFPNLTTLILEDLLLLNGNSSTDTLTFTFPVLVTLELRCCRWLKVRCVEFYAPCLRSFYSDPMHESQFDDYLIKISGARLHKFKCCGVNVENYLLNGSRVFYASLLVIDEMEEEVVRIGLRTRKLLNQLSTISQLKLSCYQAQVIAQTKSGPPLPKFNYLVKLVLSNWTELKNHLANIEALFELLHAAPSLKKLVIDMDSVLFMESQDGFDYDSMASLPSCLSSHLEEVEFIHLKNEAPHLSLAKFVVEHGAKLIGLSFLCCGMDKVELSQKIKRFPRASGFLVVDIDN